MVQLGCHRYKSRSGNVEWGSSHELGGRINGDKRRTIDTWPLSDSEYMTKLSLVLFDPWSRSKSAPVYRHVRNTFPDLSPVSLQSLGSIRKWNRLCPITPSNLPHSFRPDAPRLTTMVYAYNGMDTRAWQAGGASRKHAPVGVSRHASCSQFARTEALLGASLHIVCMNRCEEGQGEKAAPLYF